MKKDQFNFNDLTLIPFGLSGKVFRSPVPIRADSPDDALFSSFRRNKIDIVVVLQPKNEFVRICGLDLKAFYEKSGLEVIHFPIIDFNVPEIIPLDQAISEALTAAESGKNIVVHCNAGLGRTGTFLACMAVRVFGFEGSKAVGWLRETIPTAMENTLQMQFVNEYGERYAHHEC